MKNNKPDSEPCVWGSKCLIAGDVNFPSVQRKRRGKGGMTEVMDASPAITAAHPLFIISY